MGLFFRGRQEPRQEKRATVPWPMHLTAPAPYTYADINVNSAETSLQSVAVRSAIDLISSLGSELPVHVYSGEGAQRRERATPGYLLDPSGEGYGLADWVYQVLESWLLRGNLYGEILERSSSGLVTQVSLFHPDEVYGWLDTDGKVHWTVAGRPIPIGDLLHRRVNPVPGRIEGLSPIAFHAAQVGLSLTATQFGLQWFKDGAHPGGMLTNEETQLDKEQSQTAKDRFMAAVRGTREPVVLGRGWKYQQIQLNPEESQFLQTQGYTEAQCCRIFGPGIAEVLGYESGGSLTYANVESRSAHLLVYSLNKWLRRIERLLTEMLPRPQYVRIDRDALLQSTTLERYRAHESALKNRWKTVNEVRSDEDMPAVEWGNEPNGDTEAAPEQDPTTQEPTGAEAPKDGNP